MATQTGITAIVTAFRRVDQTLSTLDTLLDCTPPPDEIIVHVDGNELACAQAIHAKFPDIQVLLSSENVGPGGARNKLLRHASFSLVSSFDDDSYPIDKDFFQKITKIAVEEADASVFVGKIFHLNEEVSNLEKERRWVADFTGGASTFRRDHLIDLDGYVPLATAYGMEEVDMAIRLHESGRRIRYCPELRVFHNTDLTRHQESNVTANSLSNLALLVALRYPIVCWPIGVAQVFKRIIWLVKMGRTSGILKGLIESPRKFWVCRRYRKIVTARTLLSYLKLRRA